MARVVEPVRHGTYRFEDFRGWLGSGEAQLSVRNARAKAAQAFEVAGVVQHGKLSEAAGCSDSWKGSAVVDLLVEAGELREVTSGDTVTQLRVFAPGRQWRQP